MCVSRGWGRGRSWARVLQLQQWRSAAAGKQSDHHTHMLLAEKTCSPCMVFAKQPHVHSVETTRQVFLTQSPSLSCRHP